MSDSEADADALSEETLDTRLVRELANVLNDTGLTEIEVERGELRIRVAKAPFGTGAVLAAPAVAAPHAPAAAQAAAASATDAAPAPAAPAGTVVKSPMVGTVYLQPQPGAPPFVKVGERVSEGQTILLVEAMKTMNPIAAPQAGILVELLVADGQPVEYGEPLAVIG